MKIGFYPRLALRDIRKNRRMFLPYLLTCTGMVMMFYIIMALAVSDVVSALHGAGTLQSIFAMGSWVITVFSGIFLFYTNSFLIRRRKKEFGLYNILGMGKGNIARILLWETLFIGLGAVCVGLFAGISLFKLAELGLVNILHEEIAYDLTVSALAIKRSLQVFGVIFLLLFLHSVLQVRLTSAIALMRSENLGEKPPKGNWFIGLAGAGLLAAAYYLAVTIRDPIMALVVFMAAVIMVIVGTYLVMIAGSVCFCRLLQKNRRYYYKPSHFVSVSSMAYRMKRNGAGLASICILATMVLVMISSSACLYFGEEDAIEERYPRDINLTFYLEQPADCSDAHLQALREGIAAELAARGTEPENGYVCRNARFAGMLQDGVVSLTVFRYDNMTDEFESLRLFYLMPLEDYNRMMGTDETLADGEILLYANRNGYEGKEITFPDGRVYQVKKRVETFPGNGEMNMNIISGIGVVVPDFDGSVRGLDELAAFSGDRLLQLCWTWNFDTGQESDAQIALYHELAQLLPDPALKERLGYASVTLGGQAYEREDFYGLFGGLFYIGILLSIVFLLAAVLMIYYKQISEGYEDQARFEIMQKVGMTKREIRKSINAQILTVFFLPLALAAVHTAFAFPIIQKLIMAFNIFNVKLLAATTGISVVVFGVFYAVVYRLTSNAYYHIVSSAQEEG